MNNLDCLSSDVYPRFYDLQEGKILIDGKNLACLNLESYRDVVSLVSQEPTLYQGR